MAQNGADFKRCERKGPKRSLAGGEWWRILSLETQWSAAMPLTLVQFDFPFIGPWGTEMTQALSGLAQDIAQEPGLVWKVWTENKAEGRAGGIYVFDSAAAAYREKHSARLGAFGITGIVAKTFDVNGEISKMTQGPV
jgi:Putative mono-oxygenase ydhR